MAKRKLPILEIKLDTIVGGGQSLGTLEDGRKAFVWGGLPGERVLFQVTKKKSSYVEGVVTEVLEASPNRIEPKDPGSYLSTSPWQIMTLDAEQLYKAQLIKEAFDLHKVDLPTEVDVYTDGRRYGYRNKIEFSFWFDTDRQDLSLAFFRRGSNGKISVEGTSLAHPSINDKAHHVLRVLNELNITGRALKTLLIRSDLQGATAWQLYVKDEKFPSKEFMSHFSDDEVGEVIFSNPQSPASVITKKLTPDAKVLSDSIRGIRFNYATEGFFQINLPVYEKALDEMSKWVPSDKPVLDMYSGVGSIGLTIGGENTTLVEINEYAVREMQANIKEIGSSAKAILAASENALDHISADKTIIVDPPRAGLHEKVVNSLLENKPDRIIYLSCNPVTQARDVALLLEPYTITYHQGYNFFPATPHIENLVVLDKK